jgi:hypothetical protein
LYPCLHNNITGKVLHLSLTPKFLPQLDTWHWSTGRFHYYMVSLKKIEIMVG